MSRRREERQERDDILCQLARQLPEEERDSARALAKWLLRLKENHFAGLNVSVPDQGTRDRFESWVKLGNEDSLAKAAWRAFSGKATKTATSSPKEPAEPPPPPLPPLLWPKGMRQRKDSEPGFKLPLLYGYPDGTERVFCECLGDKTLHEVTATLGGRPVGYWPAVRPGTFIELNWKDDPELSRSVTYNGWRGHILAFESYRSLAGTFPKSDSSPTADIMRPFSEFASQQVERISKVLPPEGVEAWKRKVRGYPLEIRYSVNGGARPGQLTGTLLMTMEDLWVGFEDGKGHKTPVR